MTTLDNRPRTALVVVDVQNGVIGNAYRRDAVVATIARVVDEARRARVPVVWVRHHDENLLRGSDEWGLVDGLSPAPEEPVVDKSYADAFEATVLEDVLAEVGAGRLFLAGAQTDECVRATLHGALVRGYDTILVSDAHTTEDLTAWGAPPPEQVIAHTNLYWSNQRAPGRTAGTVEAAALDLTGAS